MLYQNSFKEIVSNAKLQVLLYGAHWKTELAHRGRILNCYVFSYIKEGTCRLRIFDKDYYAGSGDVILIPPNVKHDHVKDTGEPTFFMWWHFIFKIAGIIDVLGMYRLPYCFKLQDKAKFEEVFSQFSKYNNQPTRISDCIHREAKAMELVAMLLDSILCYEDLSMCGNQINVFLGILADIIDNPDKGFSLETLGDKYHMHPTYISNNFKKLFKISPIKLQRELRISKAKDLLLNECMTVTEVAGKVGYEDVDDFTRFFKMRTGVSPLRFKTNMLNQTNDIYANYMMELK